MMNIIPTSLTSSFDLQKAFYKHTLARYEMVVPNVYLGLEFDILGLRKSGYLDEIEIKISASDFKADFTKRKVIKREGKYIDTLKHVALEQGEMVCNYFSFLIPETIVDKCTIPDYAGLYTARLDNAGIVRLKESKKAPLLHKRKISDKTRYKIARKMVYRYWDLLKANCIY